MVLPSESLFLIWFCMAGALCTKTLYRAWLNAFPRNHPLSFLTNCANSLNLANPSCNQPLPLASSASLTCWRLKCKWVYCGHCVQKQLVSIHKRNYKAFSQITTCPGTCSMSSFVSIPNFCAQCGKFDALWQTYHSTNTHELTSLILLVYSTCHCGAKLINTTSKMPHHWLTAHDIQTPHHRFYNNPACCFHCSMRGLIQHLVHMYQSGAHIAPYFHVFPTIRAHWMYRVAICGMHCPPGNLALGLLGWRPP